MGTCKWCPEGNGKKLQMLREEHSRDQQVSTQALKQENHSRSYLLFAGRAKADMFLASRSLYFPGTILFFNGLGFRRSQALLS